jgi:hypothetical protein
MAEYKITKKRLAQIIKEEYQRMHLEEVEKLDSIELEDDDRQDEKLDPVGKESEDGDIDNDGDKDESDEYLKKRRKAIGKAMKKESLDSIRDLIRKELGNI